ncbi:MAG TPA: hypothetical protein VFT19_12935, partial [Solirubrobacterales bacterium]|nr:hypothetical protein [Solirubrobacterales bacterium]
MALTRVECQGPETAKTAPRRDFHDFDQYTTTHNGGSRMKLKPLGDRLIVKPIEEEETTASGIVLP